ncbi:MAG TPA: hypothetical protein VIH35_00585 [Kiritimatiellia bacterium]|jgi:hypothetical protein
MKPRGTGFAYDDLFPGEPGPRLSPVEEGGVGMHFVYVTNRNRCSYLFKPRERDGEFYDLLSATYPPGYATLYVLEKVNNVASGPDLPGAKFCVFQDPGWTHVGCGATISEHAIKVEAAEAAKANRRDHGIPTVLARVVETMDWH